jgi:hypothetical protein
MSNTPIWVARWLCAHMEIYPRDHVDRAVLDALATDERMAILWDEVREWPESKQVWPITYAFVLAQQDMSTELCEPLNKRVEPRYTRLADQPTVTFMRSATSSAVSNVRMLIAAPEALPARPQQRRAG